MWANVLTVALGASIPVALGVVSFVVQQRWSRKDNQRQLRDGRVLGYLTSAYTALCAIMPAGGVGYLTIEEKQNVEAAFRDSYLYGDDQVVSAIDNFIRRFEASNGQDGSIDDILQALRSQLRKMLSLAEVRQPGTPNIVTGWRYDSALAQGTGALTGANIELMTSEEAISVTGLSLDELLDYARDGSVAQPVQIDGSLRWFATAIRGLRDYRLAHPEKVKAPAPPSAGAPPAQQG